MPHENSGKKGPIAGSDSTLLSSRAQSVCFESRRLISGRSITTRAGWSTVFVDRCMLCEGHSWSWSTLFEHKSRRSEGHGGRWSNVLDHGSRLNKLHHCRRHIDHGCRHGHMRRRFGWEIWPQLHNFNDLLKFHTANGSSSQTHGSLGCLEQSGFLESQQFSRWFAT